MTLERPSARRNIPVCLRDVRLDVRMRAASTAMRSEPNVFTRALILAAAVAPSDSVYYVAPSAASLLAASLEVAA